LQRDGGHCLLIDASIAERAHLDLQVVQHFFGCPASLDDVRVVQGLGLAIFLIRLYAVNESGLLGKNGRNWWFWDFVIFHLLPALLPNLVRRGQILEGRFAILPVAGWQNYGEPQTCGEPFGCIHKRILRTSFFLLP
jgi:hypothetical protein